MAIDKRKLSTVLDSIRRRQNNEAVSSKSHDLETDASSTDSKGTQQINEF